MDPELLDEEFLDEEFLQKFLECDNADLDLQPPATQQQPPIPPLESLISPALLACHSDEPVPADFRIIDRCGPLAAWDPECTSSSTKPARKKRAVEPRFGAKTSESEMSTLSKEFVPQATRDNTSWALNNFNDWKQWRNERDRENSVPEDLLVSGTATELNEWLSRFVTETRKKDGTQFPTASVNLLLAGLKRHMKEMNLRAIDILSESDPNFCGLRSVRDNIARKRRSEGIGAVVKHASIISLEEEERLWEECVLGTTSPKALLNAVFFMNGKVLCLRGGREHHCLKLSQFSFKVERLPDGSEAEYVEYAENGSKNRSGSYKDKTANKVVKQYADRGMKARCYVSLLKTYFSKLPADASKQDSFYLRAKDKIPPDGSPWYIKAPVGRNTLQCMVKAMCQLIGVHGKTNHSLRATGAARLFAANVPEKMIQQRTGHRSVEALRLYERTSVAQEQTVSSLLVGTQPSSFVERLKENKPHLANEAPCSNSVAMVEANETASSDASSVSSCAASCAKKPASFGQFSFPTFNNCQQFSVTINVNPK